MAFLTPLFLLGLGAIAIPVLIHLIQREKKHVVEFPSLMFVRRIPYQSVRRRPPRRAPPPHPPLGAAADARGGHSVDRRGVRAPVHASRSDRRGGWQRR